MRPARSRPPLRPAVRLRSAPPLDPPFDDESAAAVWSRDLGGQQLTLSLPARPAGRVHRPLPVGRRTGQGGAASGPDGSVIRDGAGQPGGRGPASGSAALPLDALATASPEAQQAARRFVGTCLEILNGYRPAAQIRPLTGPAHATEIIEQLGAARTRLTTPAPAITRPGTPTPANTRLGTPAAVTGRLVTSRRPGGRNRELLRLRLLRVCEPRAGAAEAAASLGTDGRTWAIAFRLERRQGGWVGTAIALP